MELYSIQVTTDRKLAENIRKEFGLEDPNGIYIDPESQSRQLITFMFINIVIVMVCTDCATLLSLPKLTSDSLQLKFHLEVSSNVQLCT